MQVPTTLDGLRKVLRSLGFGDVVTGIDGADADAKENLMQSIAWKFEQSSQTMQDNERRKKAISYIERFPWKDEDGERMRGLNAASADDYVYHVTYLVNLDDVASKGLHAGVGGKFGGYQGHTRGRIFFTEWGGVRYWFDKIASMSIGLTDNQEEGCVPVVLRVLDDEDNYDWQEDKPGSRDSHYESFFLEGDSIPPSDVEVWDGSRWVGVNSVDTDGMLQKALEAAQTEDEGGETIYWMDDDVFKPRSASVIASSDTLFHMRVAAGALDALLDEEMILEPVEVEEYLDEDDGGDTEAIIIRRAAIALEAAQGVMSPSLFDMSGLSDLANKIKRMLGPKAKAKSRAFDYLGKKVRVLPWVDLGDRDAWYDNTPTVLVANDWTWYGPYSSPAVATRSAWGIATRGGNDRVRVPMKNLCLVRERDWPPARADNAAMDQRHKIAAKLSD